MEDDGRLRPQLRASKEGPVGEPLVRVPDCTFGRRQAGNRRIAAIGADDQPRLQRLLQSVAGDADARHPAAVLDQRGQLRTHPGVGSAASARLEQDRIEHERRTDAAPPTSPGRWGIGTRALKSSCRMSTGSTIGAPVARKALEHPKPIQKGQGRGLEHVRRQRVAREFRLFHQRNRSLARDSKVASGEPAHRPPTTTTSYSLPMGPPITWNVTPVPLSVVRSRKRRGITSRYR